MNNDDFYLEKIEQRAYCPKNSVLQNQTWAHFSNHERNKAIYIFGCSEASREVRHCLDNEFNIVGFLDNSKEKQGASFDGLPVYAPEIKIHELSCEKDAILIVMRKSTDLVVSQLEELGFHNYYSIGVLIAGIEPYSTFIKEIEVIRSKDVENIIILESTNDVDGNTGALYWYLKEHKTKYKFVWVLKRESSKAILSGTGDIGLCPTLSTDDYREYIRYLNRSKWQIWDNVSIPKVRNEQINVFLQHAGLGYKKIDKFFEAPDHLDYWLCVNEFVKEMIQPSFHMPDTVKTIYGTYPRNDVLLDGRKWNELQKITDNQFDKVIMWAPTFRNSKYDDRNDTDLEYPYGIPIIYNYHDFLKLNEYLNENKVLMLIKPHPVQKMSPIIEKQSNIIILDNENSQDLQIYKLLTEVDALISDYSSIVFDYMLLDRPIAWAIEDMNHFKLRFLMEDPMEYMPGEKLYNLKDVCGFVRNVVMRNDIYRKEREIICKRVNADRSLSGCKNVVERLGLLK